MGILFNGAAASNEHINCGQANDTDFEGDSSFVGGIVATINAGTGTAQAFMSHFGPGAKGWDFVEQTDGTILFFIHGGAAIVKAASPGAGTHSIIFRKDSTNNMQLFYDGVEVGAYLIQNAGINITASTDNLRIGARSDGTSWDFDGTVWSAFLVNGTVSDELIYSLGAGNIKTMPLDIPGIVSFWGFDDDPDGELATNDTVKDYAGSNDGTVFRQAGQPTDPVWKADMLLSYPPHIARLQRGPAIEIVWPAFPGLTQPTIVYGATTLSFPIPVSCQPEFLTNTRENVPVDGGEIEFIDYGSPQILKVRIPPFRDVAFEAGLKTFFDNHGGQKKWFTFTSGQNVRNDDQWLLRNKELKPVFGRGGLRSYTLIFERPFN